MRHRGGLAAHVATGEAARGNDAASVGRHPSQIFLSEGPGLGDATLQRMSKPFFIPSARSKPSRTAEAIDVAARYFVYELFDVTSGILGAWHVLGKVGERQATVAKAGERGWVITREVGLGKRKLVSASLTSEGRVLARKVR